MNSKGRETYIVTKNNWYYPSVKYFKSIEDANEQRNEWLSEMASINGTHECDVTIAEVIETRTVSCDC